MPVGERNCSAPCTMSRGTPICSARESISRHAIAASPGTTGSTWKPDSCSITATAAQIFSRVGSIDCRVNAAYMSSFHPARSCTERGRAVSIVARAWSGLTAGGAGDGALAQPVSHAISATLSSDRCSRINVLTSGTPPGDWKWSKVSTEYILTVHLPYQRASHPDCRATVRRTQVGYSLRSPTINASV